MGESVDHSYRSPYSGEDFGILNVACALSTARYAVTIPERFKSLNIRSTDGATFNIYKTATSTPVITVLANTNLDIPLAGKAGTVFYVKFAADTKVAEVLYTV
jgi:hypothetical protein